MPDRESEQEETAPQPGYSSDGVDLSVIRWSLSLTPAERLSFLEDRIAGILRIRALNAGGEAITHNRSGNIMGALSK